MRTLLRPTKLGHVTAYPPKLIGGHPDQAGARHSEHRAGTAERKGCGHAGDVADAHCGALTRHWALVTIPYGSVAGGASDGSAPDRMNSVMVVAMAG